MRWIGQSEDGSQVVLHRFDGAFKTGTTGDQSRLRSGLVLDVEATGINIESDQVIEFAGRPFTFDRETGVVVSVGAPFSSLSDPGVPLDPFVVQLTGIRDEDLAGHVLDAAAIRALIDAADLVIAHNARYDRPMVERAVGEAPKVWACSWSMIDWTGLGFPAGKLESLAIYHGFFFGAHRAQADVDGLLHLLTFDNPATNAPYMLDLINAARQPTYLVAAVNSPFASKAALKARRYRWNSQKRAWWKEISEPELEGEHAWLAEEVYGGEDESSVTKISPFTRYRAQ